MLNESALAEWLEYKRERKQSYKTKAGLTKVKNQLSKYSHSDQQWIVDYSIMREWIGLFPDAALKARPQEGFIDRQSSTSWADDLGTFHDTNVKRLER